MPETNPPIDLAALGLDEVVRASEQRSRPPVERWNPSHCGHSGMRIDSEGRWWHEGRRIEREALVRLFASVLRREPDGRHVLVTPAEKLDIDVAFAALRITALKREGGGRSARIGVQLNSGDALVIGEAHPLAVREGLPVVAVRHGLEASFERPVYMELATLALEQDPPGVWSGGRFFPLVEE